MFKKSLCLLIAFLLSFQSTVFPFAGVFAQEGGESAPPLETVTVSESVVPSTETISSSPETSPSEQNPEQGSAPASPLEPSDSVQDSVNTSSTPEESIIDGTLYETDKKNTVPGVSESSNPNSQSVETSQSHLQITQIETIYEPGNTTTVQSGIEPVLNSGAILIGSGELFHGTGALGTGTIGTGYELGTGEEIMNTMTIMELYTTKVVFPENLIISTPDGQEKQPTDLTIIPKEAVTQLPDLVITEINANATLENAPVLIEPDEGESLQKTLGEESNTEAIISNTISNQENPTKEPLESIFEFGIAGEHLLFSSPVTIEHHVPFAEGSLVEIKAFHAGDTDWTTDALSLKGSSACSGGISSNQAFLGKVENGKIIFQTCGASTFSVTYTGGASAPNFVDNGTRDFTGVVLTGVNFPTGSVIQDVNVYIDFRPIDNESPTGPWGVTNCYPGEKSFLLIHPDGTTVQLANAGTYTAPNTTCPQAQILYDQSAPTGIVGGAWALTGQSRQPVGNLSTLNGKSPFGTWTVRMGDSAGQDGVVFFGFRIDIQNVECGDGIITAPEVCDDNNTNNDDGCSALCSIEAGWTCTGTPSVCTLIPAPSGLRLHYDGSYSLGLFNDISGNGFNGTSFNGVTTGNQNGETVMCFNGTNQYIERATNLVTAYPFTMSTWVKSSSITRTSGIMSFGRSTATNIMYNIEHANAVMRQNAQNTIARYTNATTAMNTTGWFLITAVYSSATSRTIYVNGVSEGVSAVNVAYSSNASNRLNIGRFADSTPSNYFTGCIDDVRFYSTALTSGQVYTLYAKPAALTTSAVSVGSPQLTGTIQGTLDTITLTISGSTYTGTNLGNGTWNLSGGIISPSLPNGTYPVTLTVTNPYGRSVQYTSAFTVTIPPAPSGDFCIAGPSSISFPQIQTQPYAQTGFTATSGYFQLIDTSGADSGYYTTLQITNLSGSTTTIANTSIARQSTGIVLLSGTANTGVVLGSAFSSYSIASGTVTYIKRDPAPNGGKTGTYGAPLELRLLIPAYIKPDTYAGTITYTLYEN